MSESVCAENYINGCGVNRNRIVLHSDLNCFFASVECAENPSIASLPVAVCGETEKRHGIVLAKNYKAKSFDIKTGEAIWQAKNKCPSLVVVHPHYSLYTEYAHTVRRIYYEYSNRVEPFGMDEAFIELSGGSETKKLCDGKKIADEIRRRVYEKTRLTVSVGVSDNKAFAKLASDYKKPDATTVLGPHNYSSVISPMDIGELLFVGRSSKRILNSCGIFTIGEAAQMDEKFYKTVLGKNGETLRRYVCGYDSSPVSVFDEREVPKSLSNSSTPPHDMTIFEEVKLMICALCENICSNLRKKRLKARGVRLSIRTTELVWFERGSMLDIVTNTSSKLIQRSLEIFKAIYPNDDFVIRGIGVRACPLVSSGDAEQLSLFPENEEIQKRERLDSAIDSIRSRFGYYSIRRGITLCDTESSYLETGYEVFTNER